MPLGNTLVHPLLPHALRNYMRSTCTIWQLIDETAQDSLGAVKRTWPDDYEVLTGHVALNCSVAPLPDTAGEQTERRMVDATYDSARKNVLLNGVYTLVQVDMVAELDGVAHNIVGVPQSAIGGVTVLVVEVIS